MVNGLLIMQIQQTMPQVPTHEEGQMPRLYTMQNIQYSPQIFSPSSPIYPPLPFSQRFPISTPPFPSQTPTSSVIPLINLHRSSTLSHFNAASNPVFLSSSTRFLSVSTGYGRRPAKTTAPLGSVPRI